MIISSMIFFQGKPRNLTDTVDITLSISDMKSLRNNNDICTFAGAS